ncbi:hypothetical protein MPSEU_000954100 [Mayamaea pseudoterrestris]|nr:hypothetical protein MPSEU_000954100 [Mayamaea pseudoterrestris]
MAFPCSLRRRSRRRLIQATSFGCLIGASLSFQVPPNAKCPPKRPSPLSFRRDNRKFLDTLSQYSWNINSKLHASSLNTVDETLNEIERLRRENDQLKQSLEHVQVENERLHRTSRIVLENFEGEGKLREVKEKYKNGTAVDMLGEDVDIYNDPSLWCDELEDGACPLEPSVSFGEALRDRAYWLVGLLVLQSLSGFILSRNEALLENHPFIIFFLTMLVGAGGNAGNQASVRVIRGLALETLNEETQKAFLVRELKMAGCLSAILSLVGFLRASLFHTPFLESLAVTASLSAIVFTSVCLGAVLPLILKRVGVDPAHSSTTIQVAMDILGVYIAVFVSKLILDSPVGHVIVTALGRN